MKPKTKIQKRAEELSQTLLPLPRHIADKFDKETKRCNSKVYTQCWNRRRNFPL